MTIENDAFFCSWSGGKDSCLALYRAIQKGGQPKCLFTMFAEGGEKSRSHGLPLEVLQCQARALGIPLVVRSASWQDYTPVFTETLREFKSRDIKTGVFGDIDIEDHLQWVEAVCRPIGIKPYHPLWKQPRKKLLADFLEAGFKATVVVVQESKLDRSLLGRELTPAVLDEIEAQGADAAGENGEYHTIVTDGPIFAQPIIIRYKEPFSEDGYGYLNVQV
ncbi:MAG: diphthine--ammonia ligase [Syntrophomonadaceae bacterium]|jgi:diphthine-ammonia ligase